MTQPLSWVAKDYCHKRLRVGVLSIEQRRRTGSGSFTFLQGSRSRSAIISVIIEVIRDEKHGSKSNARKKLGQSRPGSAVRIGGLFERDERVESG